MEQSNLWKDLTGTAIVFGLAISSMGFNSTQVVGAFHDIPKAYYGMANERAYNITNSTIYTEGNYVYLDRRENKLETEAESLFGKMREATAEESTSIHDYVKSISKNTGVNFFDLC